MSLSWAAQAIGGKQQGADVKITGVSSDTRTLAPGDLFIALRGPNFDAHEFIEEAQAKGAVAALVMAPVSSAIPTLLVEDTRLGLGRLAAAWRQRFTIPVVALTGSNGKTTVKEMTAAILGVRGTTLATRGNLNNDIGVPLTLLRLNDSHRYAVIEMGANHAGEIAYLTGLARPNVALINNAAPAHLEGFGSLDGVARAKGEIYGGLDQAGTGIVNADDNFADYWRSLIGKHRCLSFGMQRAADFRVEAPSIRIAGGAGVTTLFAMQTPAGKIDAEIHFFGVHNVLNAAAASAAAYAAGASTDDIRKGLAAVQPVAGRLQLKRGSHGARLLDDTYNANPASLNAALEVLAAIPGKKILVLGDMGELGEASQVLHAGVGVKAREAGVLQLYAIGELSAAAVESFGKGGRHFSEHAALIEALRAELQQLNEAVVLIKGSRRMRMEQVVTALGEEQSKK